VRSERTRRAPAGNAAVRNAALAWTAMLIATPALAQTAEPSSKAEPVVKQLQQEIRKRDALIESLARRVEKLEQQVGKRATATPATRATVIRAVATPSAEGTQPVQPVTFPEQTTQAPTPLVGGGGRGAAPPRAARPHPGGGAAGRGPPAGGATSSRPV
jgi:hypothetical protein